MVNDPDKENIKNKSDAELEAILDSTHKTADSSYRFLAFEEKHRRSKIRDANDRGIQLGIHRMTKVILWLTIFIAIVALITLLKSL